MSDAQNMPELPAGIDWNAFRLVAVDLDGTAAGPDGRVSPEGLQALQAAEQAGLHPVIVTGRALPAAMGVWLRAGLTRPVIACGGAVIAWPSAGRPLWERPLAPRVVDRALELARELDLIPFLYGAGAIVTGRRHPWRDRLAHLNEIPIPVIAEDPAAAAGLAAWERGRVFKVVLAGEPQAAEAARPAVERGLAGLPAVAVATLPGLLEIIRPDATKEAALAELCRLLDTGREQVIAIGDGENDLGMIRWAGLGVAVANARPEVRAAARLVIGHHAEEGVARFLRAVVAARRRQA
ncbi:HAD family phosphatase [Thermaerobacter sp. PB12/4term]|nr:HAD family phosphatase [Thermaerobacter sp. PB12/4term]